MKKRKDEKVISLNEKVRLAEREEDKARAEKRKKERAERSKPTSHIFDLDLDMAMANEPLKPFDPNAAKEEADLAQAARRAHAQVQRERGAGLGLRMGHLVGQRLPVEVEDRHQPLGRAAPAHPRAPLGQLVTHCLFHHGAFPEFQILLSSSRSRTVSIGIQKPSCW